jgi:hypothetical protein
LWAFRDEYATHRDVVMFQGLTNDVDLDAIAGRGVTVSEIRHDVLPGQLVSLIDSPSRSVREPIMRGADQETMLKI